MPRIFGPAGGGGSGITDGEARLGAVESSGGSSQKRAFGDSLSEGFGVLHSQSYSAKAAKALYMEEVPYGKSGSVLAIDDGNGAPNNPGGYATVRAAMLPTIPTITGGRRTIRQSAPYLRSADVVDLHYCTNDANFLFSAIADSVLANQQAFRDAICSARLGGAWDRTSSNVAFSGTGWVNADFATQYGFPFGTGKSTGTNGDYIEETVPADCHTGEHDIFLVVSGDNGRPLCTLTVDGVQIGTLDLRPQTAARTGKNCGAVARFPNVAAGQKCRVTFSNFGTGGTPIVYFSHAGIQAKYPPHVLVLSTPHFAAYGTNSGAAHPTVTTSDADAMNVGQAAVVAEFDSYVAVADVRAAFVAAGIEAIPYGSPNTPHYSDGAHFNEYGHNVAAKAIVDRRQSMPTLRGTGPAFPHFRPIVTNAGAPYSKLPNGSEPGFASNWSNLAGTLLEFSKDASGAVTIRGYPKRSGTPANGDLIANLPPGYRPSAPTPAYGYNDQGAFVACEIRANGDVVWTAGSTALTVLLGLSARFIADN